LANLEVSGFERNEVRKARLCDNGTVGRMSKLLLGRRAGALGIALTTYDLWRRLPPEYRKRAITMARRHGPPLARYVKQQINEYRRATRP
jgi:hypothetical protein